MNDKFSLGEIVMTPGAHAALEGRGFVDWEAAKLLARHTSGDWGELTDEDRKANDDALQNGERLHSVYGRDDDELWVVTEADRSVTTILRPDEY